MISRKPVILIAIASAVMGSAVFAASKPRLASTVTSATVSGIDSGISSGTLVGAPGNTGEEVILMPPVRPPFRPPIRSPFTP